MSLLPITDIVDALQEVASQATRLAAQLEGDLGADHLSEKQEFTVWAYITTARSVLIALGATLLDENDAPSLAETTARDLARCVDLSRNADRETMIDRVNEALAGYRLEVHAVPPLRPRRRGTGAKP
jgi:hypothetical protein